MPIRAVSTRFFICLAAMLLVALPVAPAFADEILPTLEVGDEVVEASPPTIAEFEHYGPRTPDTTRDAIFQASTHIATPEQALRAEDATMAVSSDSSELERTTTTGLVSAGDSALEALVVALGGVVIVVFSLMLYHFRKE